MLPPRIQPCAWMKWWALFGLAVLVVAQVGCRTAAKSSPPSQASSIRQTSARMPTAPPVVPAAAALPPSVADAEMPERLPAVLPEPVAPPPAEPERPAELLTLADAVAIGVRDNPRLRQMAAQVQAARASADIAFAPFLPELGTGFRYSGFTVPVLPGGSFVPASLSTGVTSFMLAEAGVQYTIADFGRRKGHYGQAVHQARSQDLAWARARQTIAFEVTQAYLRLLSAQANVATREEALHDARRILEHTKAHREGGVAEREDVLRAEVELSLARQMLLTAYQGVYDAQAGLNVVMGRQALTPLRIAEIAARPALDRSLEDCLQTAITDRREIAMAREAVAAAHSGVQAARGDRLPKVVVRGTALRADSPGPLNGFVEGIGLHIDQPLYAGGRYQGEIRENEAQVAAAMAGLQVILDNVSLQVSVAYRAIDTDRQRIQLAETSVVQARENLRLIVVRYQNGNATPTDIVDAQTALVQTETSYYTSVYGYLEGLARLEYALGSDQQHLLEQLGENGPPQALPGSRHGRALPN